MSERLDRIEQYLGDTLNLVTQLAQRSSQIEENINTLTQRSLQTEEHISALAQRFVQTDEQISALTQSQQLLTDNQNTLLRSMNEVYSTIIPRITEEITALQASNERLDRIIDYLLRRDGDRDNDPNQNNE